MIEKVMVCPYFGDYPPWMDHWRDNVVRLTEHGYTFVLDTDEDAFRTRVREILDIEPPPMAGTGNVWDFRCAFGVLYAHEIGSAEWWGHTDFDCVYGRVELWIDDDTLYPLDLLSNHDTYVCGPWTLYRNKPIVNGLFAVTDEWRHEMSRDGSNGWVEKGYTQIVEKYRAAIRRRYVLWQTKDWNNFDTLKLHADGRLTEGDTEVMMAHFRRTKEYPAGCIL